jgi:hypothetical protein
MRTQTIAGHEETGNAKVMVVVCGELQGDESAGDRGGNDGVGFVEFWGGRMGARVRKRGQGQRVQVQHITLILNTALTRNSCSFQSHALALNRVFRHIACTLLDTGRVGGGAQGARLYRKPSIPPMMDCDCTCTA